MELVLGVFAIAFTILEIKEYHRILQENEKLSKKYNDLRVENARLKSKAGR